MAKCTSTSPNGKTKESSKGSAFPRSQKAKSHLKQMYFQNLCVDPLFTRVLPGLTGAIGENSEASHEVHATGYRCQIGRRGFVGRPGAPHRAAGDCTDRLRGTGRISSFAYKIHINLRVNDLRTKKSTGERVLMTKNKKWL